jgi:hypothetical protein
MSTFTKFFAAMMLVLTSCLATVASAQEAEDPAPTDGVITFMRAKLDHAQHVLEGLTTDDFDMIAKGAGQMEVLSQEAAWQVLQTPEYRQQSGEFRRATRALKDAALKKNLDAAALAYVDVTLKCVRCHEYVRHVRSADARDVVPRDAADALPQQAVKPLRTTRD